ncbi:hypothetical protein WR25_08248 [Diploscapter pachys]|uniref:Uncharacterized protein n=1 Tax=Diploscapter pachys TaxID=2018661 RepID=A0A2A2LHI7_9BILA|nr:hypothetical protein WR25_08248 [Diploscapter pachys]
MMGRGDLAIDIGHLVAGVFDSEASAIGGRVELDSLKGEHRLRRLSQVAIFDKSDAGRELVGSGKLGQGEGEKLVLVLEQEGLLLMVVEKAEVGLQRCMSGWSGLLLTGHFGVRFGKLESENLKLVSDRWNVVAKRKRLSGFVGVLSADESDEPNRRGGLAVLRGHLEQRRLVTAIGSEQQVEFARLSVHGQSGDEESADLRRASRVGGADAGERLHRNGRRHFDCTVSAAGVHLGRRGVLRVNDQWG